MNQAFDQWLDQCAPCGGVLACAARAANGALVGRAWAEGYTEAALENALRCVADLFQVIQHHRIAPGRVRWVFGNVLLHCERRADGTCFGVFTAREAKAVDAEGLERMFAEFRTVGQASAVAA